MRHRALKLDGPGAQLMLQRPDAAPHFREHAHARDDAKGRFVTGVFEAHLDVAVGMHEPESPLPAGAVRLMDFWKAASRKEQDKTERDADILRKQLDDFKALIDQARKQLDEFKAEAARQREENAALQREIAKMRDLTKKPFGVNIAQAFVRDPNIVQFVIDQGVKFVTTSAGDPTKYCRALKDAGLTVFHVVPTLKAALKAVDAGVDGLVVEGAEGGGFKNPRDVHHGAVAAGLLEGRRAGDRRRWHLRRADDGGRVRARRRRRGAA